MAFSSALFSPLTFTPNPNRPVRKPFTVAAIPPLSTATDVASIAQTLDGTTVAVIGGGSVATLAAVLSLTDPERRRKIQAEEVGGGDKEVAREYFNNNGFQRWKKIYGETDDVNRVQLDIRIGHSKTVENTLEMLNDEGSLQGVTVCDAGYGIGLLSIPLAKEGAIVYASDISAAMVAEAQKWVSREEEEKKKKKKRKEEIAFAAAMVAEAQKWVSREEEEKKRSFQEEEEEKKKKILVFFLKFLRKND